MRTNADKRGQMRTNADKRGQTPALEPKL
jgi:hypothetical protein